MTTIEEVEGFFEHFGVKGMKWGVRKTDPASELKRSQKKWDRKAEGTLGFYSDYSKAARRMNPAIQNLKNKPKYRGKDLREWGNDRTLAKEYEIEVGNVIAKAMGHEALRRAGRRPGTGERVVYNYQYSDGDIVFGLSRPSNARHDAMSDAYDRSMDELESLEFVAKRDARGFVTDIVVRSKPAAQSDLTHFGVKGMKWGIRRAEAGARSQKKAEKAEKKWEKKASRRAFTDYNQAAKLMNSSDVPRINNKPEYKNANLNGNTPLSRRYHKEMNDALAKHMTASAKAAIGSSPLGQRELKYTFNQKTGDVDYRFTDAKHAAVEDFYFVGKRDANGFIVSIEVVEETSLSQALVDNEALTHFGVKGMKWGVRRADRPESSADSVVFKGIKTKGKDGVRTLSNEELQTFIARANLEKQFKALNPSAFKRGQEGLKTILGIGRTANEALAFASSPAGKQMGGALMSVPGRLGRD